MQVIKGAGAFTAPDAGSSRRYDEHLRVSDLSVGTYSIPVGGVDGQQPHNEDEIYVVTAGRARLVADSGEVEVGPGTVVYVPAGEAHRFVDVTADLAVLVLFAPAEGVRLRPPMTEAEIRQATVGPVERLTGRIEISDYDPEWPAMFAREAERIRGALGDRVLLLEHAGSTSVPGLPAKPRIDIVLAVADSADEPGYAPDLAAAGYRLQIRESDWYEHRMFKGPDTDVNLHVFSVGCPEIDRMLLFRDWLRTRADDRERYAAAKRRLAEREWTYTQQYADAKTEVVEEIIARAVAHREALARPQA
ncbi:GrpB family protein [Planosporangium sp. 12N6]|uniref:GrpB family protein n=1 Tax=Planosporangium spinosum TaxID=3402278 RepID=UPI003CF5B375